MKKVAIVTALLLAFLVVVLPAAAITWGQPDTTHDNVGAMVVDWPGFGPFQVCTGTLVHPQVVLTAGHCTVDWDAYGVTTFWVNFDENALNPATLLDVAAVIPHPDYNWGPTSDPHDVGALVLAQPVAGITPAQLPAEGFLDDLKSQGLLRDGNETAQFTVVGYGGSLEWPPPVITYDDHRQFAESAYQKLLNAWLVLSQNPALGNGGTCFGDSGGPTFWTNPDGTETLVGLTSWGDSVCVAAGFNYRVDIPQTLDFIDDVIDGLD